MCFSILHAADARASVVFPRGSLLPGEGYGWLRESATKHHAMKLNMVLLMQETSILNQGVTKL